MSKVPESQTYGATVISVVPFEIIENKPGIYPGTFTVPASKDEVPQVLNVGESIYFVETSEPGRSITVRCSPNEVARSIVEDYLSSNLAYSSELQAAPGVFWVMGKFSQTEILTKFSKEIETAKKWQLNWFRRLVEMADDDWEKTRQHRTISDMQRFACKAMGLNRPWIIAQQETYGQTIAQYSKCPACQSNVLKEAIVCSSCRCILNIDKYKSMKFAIAE